MKNVEALYAKTHAKTFQAFPELSKCQINNVAVLELDSH